MQANNSTKDRAFEPQKLGRFSQAVAIYLADFPIYYIECISECHFVVAGGGGGSETGVYNQIDIVELNPTDNSCAADPVMRFRTPKELPDAIMAGSLCKNLPIVNTRLVTGGSEAVIYHIVYDPRLEKFIIKKHEILRNPKIRSQIKSVKYFKDKILLGGFDGQLTFWNMTSGEVERQLKAHTKPIAEIDVDEAGQQIVTVSRDENRCCIWNASNGKLIHEFTEETINPDRPKVDLSSKGPKLPKYSYRSARFACDATSNKKPSSNTTFLLIACNINSPKAASKLFRWTSPEYNHHMAIPVTTDGVMAMTVSLDGKCVAIGSGGGSVSICEVKKLTQIYHIDNAHKTFVTNLEFLPPRAESLSLTNSKLCPLLSVSVDRRIVIHRPGGSSFLVSLLERVSLGFFVFLLFSAIYRFIN